MVLHVRDFQSSIISNPGSLIDRTLCCYLYDNSTTTQKIKDLIHMRVLNSITDPRMGGPQRRSLAVAKQSDPNNIETVFLVPTGSDEFAEIIRDTEFEIRRIDQPRIRAPRNVNENIRFLLSFRRVVADAQEIIAEADIDVVHVNMSSNIQVARAAALSNAQLVWHLNSMVIPSPLNRVVGMLAKSWADEIIVSSKVVDDYYFFQPVEAAKIYPPVDLQTFNQDKVTINDTKLRTQLGVDSDSILIGAVGNINPAKGYSYFLEAISGVTEVIDNVDVIIVGSKTDSQQSYIRQLQEKRSKLGLNDTVHFVGWRTDVPELMSLFDLFVLSSVSESGPMVVPEAMAMNCPVVMTNVGIIPEQFEDGEHGWIVPPEDSSALTTAIIDALNSPKKRERFVRKARKKVYNTLAVNIAADRHQDVYSSALESTDDFT